MLPTQQGSFRLFRFAGIVVFVHYSWFIIALYEISSRIGGYSSPVWNVGEYLALFVIVLMHEYGHALACRQVGGKADQIVLWPLGGVAYVDPPDRPGATLWTICAGPLVNVILVPVLFLAGMALASTGVLTAHPDLIRFIRTVETTNFVLLVFNLLPIYPLDGGQILRSLLWFPFGRSRSLMIASFIGFFGVAALGGLAYYLQSWWIAILAFFALTRCLNGWKQAQALLKIERAPRRLGAACPSCKKSPPEGPFWRCARCRQAFDIFAGPGVCPNCSAQYDAVSCGECGAHTPIRDWFGSAAGSSTIDV